MGVLEKTRRSSLYWKEIMNTLMGLLLLLVAGFRAVRPGAIEVAEDTRNYDVRWETNVTEEKSEEERLRELRIEMVKFQILAKLNLKEPLPSVSPPSESARETIRLLLGETGEQQRQPQNDLLDREERLVIHSKSDHIQCLQTDGNNCRLFQYELSTTLNASSMCLWLYKTEDSLSMALSVLVSYSNTDEEKSFDQIVSETRQVGWNKIALPSILVPPSWNETFVCSVEIKGEDIEHHGDHRPFLMVSKSPYVASRQRRDVSCDSNESCCMKPLTVTFSEIGFNWVLYPVELQANMCTGKCRLDHSAMRTHYERAMTKILEKDNTIQDFLGDCWTLCCKPKQLDAVRVIYNDTDGIIHDQYLPELTVSSCSCS